MLQNQKNTERKGKMKIATNMLFLLILLTPVTIFAQSGNQPAKNPDGVDLFASQNLDDWDFFSDDPSLKKEDVWSFTKEGYLFCTGKPIGFLCTKKEDYRDFKLTVQWRWPEGVEPTNSGVFLRLNGQFRPLPCCIEAQLKHGDAGDIWTFHGFGLEGYDNTRVRRVDNHELGGKMAGITKLFDAENKPGEWNTYEILCQGGTVVLSVNGRIINWTKDIGDKFGRIGLQSEGGPIEFRNFIVTPLNRTEN